MAKTCMKYREKRRKFPIWFAIAARFVEDPEDLFEDSGFAVSALGNWPKWQSPWCHKVIMVRTDPED